MGGIAFTMAHKLLRMFDAGMRRRKRRLKYAQRLASQRESSMHIADLNKADTKIQTCNAYAVLVSTRNVSVVSVLACMKRFSGHYYEPFQWSLHSNLLKRFGGLYGNEYTRFRLHVWPHSRKKRTGFIFGTQVRSTKKANKQKETKGNKRKQKETKGNKTTTEKS